MCLGTGTGNGRLQFQAAKPIESFQRGPVRWRNALAAGARWSGTLIFGSQPARKIALTVAEVREEGRAYQLILHNPDDDRWFRVFTATLDDSDKTVDGYAMHFKPNSTDGLRTSLHSIGFDLYGNSLRAKHKLRLSADRKMLLGVSAGGELIQMVPVKTPATRPLDRMSVAKLSRKSAWPAGVGRARSPTPAQSNRLPLN